MHQLVFYRPGHFHAALTLRRNNPRISPDIHIYGPAEPDLDSFCALVESFNARPIAPTQWIIHRHTQHDPLERLMAEQPGAAVVLAGRNDEKMRVMARLHEAGHPVLADKPWIINPDDLELLAQVTAGSPLVMDIMTGTKEVMNRIRHRIVSSGLLGPLASGDPTIPAIEIGSIHHLRKLVNGKPLLRPAWYFDISVQGDGLVDIHSHMVNQAQWLLDEGRIWNFETDMALTQARRWDTAVPLELFREVTGLTEFPASLAPTIRADVLRLACNGQIDYALLGTTIRQTAIWNAREAEGGGDEHSTVIRGQHATLEMRVDSGTGFKPEMRIHPISDGFSKQALLEAVGPWQADFPGLAVELDGSSLQILVPESLDGGHESHFALVLEQFLDLLDGGEWSPAMASAIRTRYTLLARAHEQGADLASP